MDKKKQLSVDDYIRLGLLLKATREALNEAHVLLGNTKGVTKSAGNVRKICKALSLVDDLRCDLDSELFSNRNILVEVSKIIEPKHVFYSLDVETTMLSNTEMNITIRPLY